MLERNYTRRGTHTPGPFTYRREQDGVDDYWFIVPASDERDVLASILFWVDDDEASLGQDEANARLFAAASDLLQALRALLTAKAAEEPEGNDTAEKVALTALAKVEGVDLDADTNVPRLLLPNVSEHKPAIWLSPGAIKHAADVRDALNRHWLVAMWDGGGKVGVHDAMCGPGQVFQYGGRCHEQDVEVYPWRSNTLYVSLTSEIADPDDPELRLEKLPFTYDRRLSNWFIDGADVLTHFPDLCPKR